MWTLQQLADLLKAEFKGSADQKFSGVASLEEADSNQISYVAGEKYLKQAAATKAGALIVKKGTETAFSGALLFVEDPQWAFVQILRQIEAQKNLGSTERGVHPTAVVAPQAKVAANVSIGAHAVIEAGAQIGEGSVISALVYVGKNAVIGQNSFIYPFVTLREEVVIGNRVVIHSGSVIGSDGFGYVFKGGRHEKIPQIGTVLVEDDVEIGANVTIDRATLGKTKIGRGSKIDNLVQIAHNVQIGQGCILVAQAGVAGSSTLGNFVTLAGQAGVVGHIRLGDRSVVAAQSGISNDVEAGAIVFGSPARPIAEERRIQVLIGKLPKIYEDIKRLKKFLKLEEPLHAETKNHS